MIFDRALRQLRHADPTFGVDAAKIPTNSEGPGTWAGVPVSERRALQFGMVWSCVSLISDTLEMLPTGAFRTEGPARTPVEGPRWLEEGPNEEVDRGQWIGGQGVSVLLRGNAYNLVTERDRLQYATQFQPLHPDEVQPRRVEGRRMYRVRGYKELIPARDMLHVRGMSLPGVDHLEALSPIAHARQTIGAALAASEFGARFFSEGAQPAGVLQSDVNVDDDVARKVLQGWVRTHGNRRRIPAVLGGGLKWQPISLKPEEAQFLETIEAKGKEIAGWYRVPLHMVGQADKTSNWGTGVEEHGLQFITFTLGIWISRLEREFTRFMRPPTYARFNVAGLLRGRILDQYRAFLMGRQGGWLNVDEVRALLEMPPLPQGKGTDYLTPLNYGPVPAGGLADQLDPAKPTVES